MRPAAARSRGAIAALSVSTLMAGGALIAAAAPAQARMNVHCAGDGASRLGPGDAWSAGIRAVDPIVSRGLPESPHEHQFFGNIGLLAMERPDLANHADMLALATSCNMAKDTAAYWSPTLRYISGPLAGQLVPLKRFEMYYQSWNDKVTDPLMQTTAFPKDLRMLAGNPMAQSEAEMDLNAVNFSCSNFSSKAARNGFKFPTPQAANCATATDIQPVPGRQNIFLTAIVHFPTCWSGRLNDHTVEGNTADFMGEPGFAANHMAYAVGGRCPSGFPVKLPKARFTEQWDYRGDGTDIAFSSGMDAAARQGFTFHADFWNTWDQASLKASVNACINTKTDDKLLHIVTTPRNPGLCGIAAP